MMRVGARRTYSGPPEGLAYEANAASSTWIHALLGLLGSAAAKMWSTLEPGVTHLQSRSVEALEKVERVRGFGQLVAVEVASGVTFSGVEVLGSAVDGTHLL